jgi:hypothetical protein
MDGKRSDAIWYSRACAVRWARENPGKSLYEARKSNIGRTRKRSGRQVSARKIEVVLITRYGMTVQDAFSAVSEALPVKQKRPSNVVSIHARNKKTRDQREAA